jgi:hypothetical protein
MAHRIRPVPTPSAPRPTLPPADRGTALWQTIYKSALKGDTEEARLFAEKMADTALRAREKSLALLESRPKLLLTKAPPKPSETCGAEKKGRAVLHAAFRCKAQTLEGKQCGFKATCGDFCKKHTPI